MEKSPTSAASGGWSSSDGASTVVYPATPTRAGSASWQASFPKGKSGDAGGALPPRDGASEGEVQSLCVDGLVP